MSTQTHPGAAHGFGKAEVLGPADGFAAAGVAVLLLFAPALSLPTMPSLACIMGSWTSCDNQHDMGALF